MPQIPETPRLKLPLLAAAQAQKEITHNEALSLIDAALHPAIIADNVADPPGDAQPGQCWIVPASATGAWAGRDGHIAVMTDGGWRFLEPFDGLDAWLDGRRFTYRNSGWHGAGPVPEAAGGTVIDVEAREAIAALTGALEAAGIIAIA